MTQAPDRSGLVGLLVQLAWRDERVTAAAGLADRLGVESVLIFIRDQEVDAMLVAPGMEQTLRGGPAWRAFLRRCIEPGRHEADVDLPLGVVRTALALVWGNIAMILLGGKAGSDDLAAIEQLLPVLGAALGCEQQVLLANAEAAEARVAAGHANVLARALESSRADGAVLNVRLREEHRRKDDFLAMLAHELRNPLSPLVTSIDLLRRRGGDAQLVKRQLLAMSRQVDQLSRLVEDLLDVSRVSHGRISLRRELLTLPDVIEQALDSARLLIDVRRHRVTLEGMDQPLVVDADRVRLTQVFANLINNAAKYADLSGDIRISIAQETADGGVHAVVRVADNGMGISAAMLPRIFDLFEQSPATRGRAHGGLGIGLTLVKSLVGLHGGSVHADSAGLGEGSTFTVRLPLSASAAPPMKEEEAAETPVAASEDVLRVLVVDDNRDAAESLAELLRILGHHAEVAFSGLKAIQINAELDADLLMLDIGLPEMDGHELARRLRRLGPRHAWIVALTGFGSEDDKRRSLEAGFDEHVVKPVKLGLLKEILGRATRQRKQQDEARQDGRRGVAGG
jgi:signal transduction histidine kinase/AmiR/NasT family two-component response regulator